MLLEELSRQVECVKTAHMDLNDKQLLLMIWYLQSSELKKEKLSMFIKTWRVKSTVRVWCPHYSIRLWLMFPCSDFRSECQIPPLFPENLSWQTLGRITRGISPKSMKVAHVEFQITRPCFHISTFCLLSWEVVDFAKLFIVCPSNKTHTHIPHTY